mgnify:CR=1 FL=1
MKRRLPITINVNGLSLCHKASGGVSIATLPDVCKTPSPGGPVPVPYPNVARSRDLAKGTKTINADGGNMCARFGSEFSRSTGDEPGTLGGVKSGTFTKEATWITYSFDVKFEGKGACRLTDKMFHNHQNTVNAGGLLQRVLDARKVLVEMLCECDKEIQPTKNDTCMSLGNKKHECMEKKKAEHNGSGKSPKLDGERGYNYKTGKPDTYKMSRQQRFTRLAELKRKIKTAKTALESAKWGRKALKIAKSTPVSFVVGLAIDYLIVDPAIDAAFQQLDDLIKERDAIGKSLKDTIFPDGALRGEGGKIEAFFEYKFGCPKGVKSGTGVSTGEAIPGWSDGQEERVDDLLAAMKASDSDSVDPEAVSELLTNAVC